MSENGLVYAMDFRGMYWNSRLGTERARLVDSFDENDVVLDLCCGVGPIALPASKKYLAVYANDLNPAAVAYLGRNAKRNKGTSLAGVTNLDAGECLRVRIAEFAAAKKKGGSNFDERDLAKMRFTRVVMNLPQGSLDAPPVLRRRVRPRDVAPEFLPIVHAYAFQSRTTRNQTRARERRRSSGSRRTRRRSGTASGTGGCVWWRRGST